LVVTTLKHSIKSSNSGVEPLEEFYPDAVIAAIPNNLEDRLGEFLDKREKQIFQCLCWNSTDEILLVTQQNCIYKVCI
jgi:hypothetical protein